MGTGNVLLAGQRVRTAPKDRNGHHVPKRTGVVASVGAHLAGVMLEGGTTVVYLFHDELRAMKTKKVTR